MSGKPETGELRNVGEPDKNTETGIGHKETSNDESGERKENRKIYANHSRILVFGGQNRKPMEPDPVPECGFVFRLPAPDAFYF